MGRFVVGLACAMLVGAVQPGRLGAQGGPPPLPAPREYGVTLGLLNLNGWEGDAASSGTGALLTMSRTLLGPLRVRSLIGTVGTDVLTGAGRVDSRLFLIELGLAVAPEFRVAPGIALRPAATLSAGVLILDPSPEPLTTRSQNAWSWGGAVDLLVGDRWLVTAEFRRLMTHLEDPTVEGINLGEPTHASALSLGVGARF